VKNRLASWLRRIADKISPQPQPKPTLVFLGDLGLHFQFGSGGGRYYVWPEVVEEKRKCLEGDCLTLQFPGTNESLAFDESLRCRMAHASRGMSGFRIH
jgi:hypothetical protein